MEVKDGNFIDTLASAAQLLEDLVTNRPNRRAIIAV